MLRALLRLAPLVALPALLVAQEARDPAARVDSIFAPMGGADAPGCAVGVARGGSPVLARAYGMANLEYGVANRAETVFEAGSVSKQFTAAAVVLLALDGTLSLDDPARRWLPELPPYGDTVTLRQMLNHTSGLRDWGTVVSAAGWPRGSRVHTHAHVLEVASRQRSLNFPPGSEYLYSNTGYNLLAMIVERASGESFADFTRRRLFEPLGMSRTQWRDDYTRIVRDRATAYDRRDGAWHLDMPFENVHGNGGLLTTVGDLLRWNEHLAHPGASGAALVAELERRGRLTSGRQIDYAEGLVVSSWEGEPEVSHSGATAGYRAFLARYPARGLSVAVLCNRGDAAATTLARAVVSVFAGPRAARPSPPLAAGVALPAARMAALAGTYRDARTGEPLEVRLRGDTLAADGRPLLFLSPTTWRSPSGATTGRFVLGAGGIPTALEAAVDGDTTRWLRAEPWGSDAAALASYVGEYRSEEAEATYAVVADSGRLTLLRRPGTRIALAPAYRDAFRAPGLGLVTFRRDAAGRVVALSLGMGRVRDLRFERADSAGRAAASR
jgi:CubicO group peptidase (beta-lactamase class C family)